MPFDAQDNLFLLPGPVKMHPRVLAAMARPAAAHRGPEFSDTVKRLESGLKQVIGAPHVAMMTGSGTAGMEAAISNLVHWGDRAIGLDNGNFGSRMAKLAKRYAVDKAVTVTSPWGQGVDLEALKAELEKGGTTAVCFTLNETSTGVMNQGRDIAALCRKHDALCIADTITATGAVPVPMQEWGLDVSIVGSQKCLGGPSGLVFVGVSERAYQRLDSPSLYLDVKKHVEKQEKEQQTPFTPAVPLFAACLEGLEMLQSEGLEDRFKRTKKLADGCRAAAEAAGLELAADKTVRSNTVTAIKLPAGIDDKQVRGVLKDRFNVIVGGGQEAWKGRVFRIGHMGTVGWAELAAGWAAIEACFKLAGKPLPKGAAVGAMMDFA
ncbi:MAG TPA: alanine--glyoxylate aminotransferase family protein [Candidatus Thermoplasmatota archaeon]|nr:alanine--glyoxylate aminotransferase family protein [Candidatus Thermoplasmatota archaeon]